MCRTTYRLDGSHSYCSVISSPIGTSSPSPARACLLGIAQVVHHVHPPEMIRLGTTPVAVTCLIRRFCLATTGGSGHRLCAADVSNSANWFGSIFSLRTTVELAEHEIQTMLQSLLAARAHFRSASSSCSTSVRSVCGSSGNSESSGSGKASVLMPRLNPRIERKSFIAREKIFAPGIAAQLVAQAARR